MPLTSETAPAALPQLQASADGRRIVGPDGKAIFLLADAAWELFRRADRAEAEAYLADRAAKGFNMLLAAVLADGLETPNAQGERPFRERAPGSPNEAYFAHIDWIVDRAAAYGMYTAMMPIRNGGSLALRDATSFGEWLGRRYRERPILWVLEGGEERHADRERQIARGLRAGDGGAHLVAGLSGSADGFDLDSRPASGELDAESPFSRSALPVARLAKPFLPLYALCEDAPLGEGYSNAADARRAFYANIFRGACGHVYGHHSVWQFHQAGPAPTLDPMLDWREALQQPGASQMAIGCRLLASRPTAFRQVDDSILANPGRGLAGALAMRDDARRWAMAYVPEGRPCDLRLDALKAVSVRAWRFDPRTGAAANLGMYPAQGVQRFAPPARGERLDWILVLDDASLGWGAPGNPSAKAL